MTSYKLKKNGKIIDGTIVKYEDGVIHFKSDATGTVYISSADHLVREYKLTDVSNQTHARMN